MLRIILLAYFFIYRYITTPTDAPFKKCLPPLALSGIFFGIGCASKWVVLYAGAGLAVIYLIRIIQLGKHYKKNSLSGFNSYLTKTLLFSVLFFVLVPAAIYCLSYIPFGLARGMTLSGGMLWNADFYKIVLDSQKLMFNYHSGLEATHPYSSKWWQWIINARPILFYNTYIGDKRSSFASFGNPVVWWGGFTAIVFMVINVIENRDAKALFIVIGYLSQLVPWIPVTRVVFIYHYFPSTLFIVLALSHVFNTILERKQGLYKTAVYGYTAAAGAVFALFFPALTGVPAMHLYFRDLLKWVPNSWPF